MDEEQEFKNIAQLLMQSKDLDESIEIIRKLADKYRYEGYDKGTSITSDNMVDYREIPNILFKGNF